MSVRGDATPEEVAAVLAVLARRAARHEDERDGYDRWLAIRRHALRRDSRGDGP